MTHYLKTEREYLIMNTEYVLNHNEYVHELYHVMQVVCNTEAEYRHLWDTLDNSSMQELDNLYKVFC